MASFPRELQSVISENTQGISLYSECRSYDKRVPSTFTDCGTSFYTDTGSGPICECNRKYLMGSLIHAQHLPVQNAGNQTELPWGPHHSQIYPCAPTTCIVLSSELVSLFYEPFWFSLAENKTRRKHLLLSKQIQATQSDFICSGSVPVMQNEWQQRSRRDGRWQRNSLQRAEWQFHCLTDLRHISQRAVAPRQLFSSRNCKDSIG